jgi:hypothetical protein
VENDAAGNAGRAAAGGSPGGGTGRCSRRVLRLRSVEQVDVSPEREVTLRLAFSDEPDRSSSRAISI